MARRKKQIDDKVFKWLVAVVVRLSKEDLKKPKKENHSDSIENQIKIIEEKIADMVEDGENITIYDYYIDDGKSGALAEERPNFLRLLNDIEENKVNCVIVKDSSRLARNSKESTEFVEEYFVRKNVRYISLMLPTLDSLKNPEEIGSLGTKMYDIVNEDYIRQTSIKIREILNLKKRLGLFVGSHAPYGFKKDPINKHHLVIDEYASNVLCDMRDWVFNGMSLKQVQLELHKLNILNPTAYKIANGENYNNPHYDGTKETWWSITTIRRLLLSQMNVGDMVQNFSSTKSYKVKEKIYFSDEELIVVENTHNKIFSRQDRNRLISILNKETKTIKTDNGNKVYLFTGFLKCADCGRSITRKYNTIKENGYFQCKNYLDYGNEVCTRHYITEKELAEAVLCSIQAQISLLEDYEVFFNEVQKSSKTKTIMNKIVKAIEKQEAERKKLIKIKDNLYLDWKSDDLTHEDYLRLKLEFEAKLDDIKGTLKELNFELKELECGEYEDIFEKFKTYRNVTELNREILTELIDCIYVHENKEIDIVYRISDKLEMLEETQDKIKKKSLYQNVP